MKLGILGVGNMGGAILKGYSAVAEDEIIVFDADAEKLAEASKLPKVEASKDMADLIRKADSLIIALKPNIFDVVMPQIAEITAKIDDSKVIVSIAAGITIKYMQRFLGEDSKIIRVMPNTPAMVGEGMAALSASRAVTDEEFAEIINVFRILGKAKKVDEGMMDVVTGISGSSPAYAYMYIQALMECGIKNGLEPDEAKSFAAQATLGAAKMVLENDISPEQLRINVCSPGGTTIEAVNSLFDNNFMEIIENAMDAAIAKSKLMKKE